MPAPVTSVFLPAGQKTLVIYSSFAFTTYYVHFQVPSASISWEETQPFLHGILGVRIIQAGYLVLP